MVRIIIIIKCRRLNVSFGINISQNHPSPPPYDRREKEFSKVSLVRGNFERYIILLLLLDFRLD